MKVEEGEKQPSPQDEENEEGEKQPSPHVPGKIIFGPGFAPLDPAKDEDDGDAGAGTPDTDS